MEEQANPDLFFASLSNNVEKIEKIYYYGNKVVLEDREEKYPNSIYLLNLENINSPLTFMLKSLVRE